VRREEVADLSPQIGFGDRAALVPVHAHLAIGTRAAV
jgi:hypothetical protein